MASEDGEGAVDLLGEDGAGEFVGQGDIAEGEYEASAGTGGGGPAVCGTDGEDDGLGSGVAEATEMGCEFFGGELLAAAIEEDEDGNGAGGLAVDPGEEGGFGVVVEGLAGEVARGSGEIAGGQGCGGIGLGASASWGDGGEEELHGISVPR